MKEKENTWLSRPSRFAKSTSTFIRGEDIPGVAASFDADEYANTLVRAHVNSVTTFARCHHGFLYYDSERFPERIHPNLTNKNLLKEQIEACHARSIRVPIYITVQWDHYTATRHPEWLQQTAEGRVKGTPPFEAGFYRNLMVNSPYLDFLKAQTKEVLETLPTDGIFFDIVKPLDGRVALDGGEDVRGGLRAERPGAAYGVRVRSHQRFQKRHVRVRAEHRPRVRHLL